MNKVMKRYAVPLILLLALAGCGGGGENGTGAPAKAVVKLSTLATGSAQVIGGISVTLKIPAGVTVKVVPDGSGQTADGVVVKSGAADFPNSSVIAKYTPATGKMDILIVKSDGFSTGEFVTITCDLSGAASPAVGDFGTGSFSAFDLTGSEITGLEVSHTLEMK